MMRMAKRFALVLTAAVLLLACGATAASADYAVVTNTNTLNVRSGPGTDYAWLGSVPRGTWVDIVSQSGSWYSVSVVDQALSGFMSGNFLTMAQSGGTGTFTVANPSASGFLNLREYPSYSAKVLGIFYNGASGTILSESGGWYQVYINGVTGYFRGEFLRVNGGYSSTYAYINTQNGGRLNMRAYPSYAAGVSGSFNNGTQVMVLLKGNDFWFVSVGGKTGFMASKFLSERAGGGGGSGSTGGSGGYAVVSNPGSGQKLNLRAQPSTSAKALAKFGNGTQVNVLAQGAKWCKVSVSGITGYMMTRYLSLYNLPATPYKTVTHPSGTYVNLRSTPSKTSGTVYARVTSGSAVTLLTPGDEWSQVQYGGTKGYMMTYFLR